MDLYEKISHILDRLVDAIRLFVKKEMSQQEMFVAMQKEATLLLSLGKQVGGKIEEDIVLLGEDVVRFVQNIDDPHNECALIKRCVTLKNDLWEL